MTTATAVRRAGLTVAGLILAGAGYVAGAQYEWPTLAPRSATPASAPNDTPLFKEYIGIGSAAASRSEIEVQVVRLSGGGQPQGTILRIGVRDNRTYRERQVVVLTPDEARGFLTQLNALDRFLKAGKGTPRSELHARASERLSVVGTTKDDGSVSESVYLLTSENSDLPERLYSLDRFREQIDKAVQTMASELSERS